MHEKLIFLMRLFIVSIILFMSTCVYAGFFEDPIGSTKAFFEHAGDLFDEKPAVELGLNRISVEHSVDPESIKALDTTLSNNRHYSKISTY